MWSSNKPHFISHFVGPIGPLQKLAGRRGSQWIGERGTERGTEGTPTREGRRAGVVSVEGNLHRRRTIAKSQMVLLLIFCFSCAVASTTTVCPHPFIPANGHVVFDAPAPYFLNTVAKYSCAPEFEKVGGTDERMCSSSGSWSGEAPVCRYRCGRWQTRLSVSVVSSLLDFPRKLPLTATIRLSWWEVDLLSSYSVHGVAIRLGKQSSPILNVYLIQQNGDLRLMCECMAYLGGSSVTFQLCDISGYAFFENTTVYVHCELADVEKVRIVAENRLHLCEARVYATNA
ncbi:sushi domain protein, partial [Ostertagia ostertagi]